MSICTVEDCSKPTRSLKMNCCNMHYQRLWRHGSFARLRSEGPGYVNEEGYRVLGVKEHPAAPKGSRQVYEHRAVFYDHNGPGPHRCHWCDILLDQEWHVDHLDYDRANNRPDNLKASCVHCNTSRVRRDEHDAVSNAVKLTLNGVTRSSSWWARKIGISRPALMHRLKQGWPLELALTAPANPGRARPNQE